MENTNKIYKEYYEFIKNTFIKYEQRKEDGMLYSKDDFIPQNLIKLYFGSSSNLAFEQIVLNFKTKYINNENEIENVHNIEEFQGMSEVYDYINDCMNDKCPNIYVLLVLHSLLYSKVPYPEFGGKFRKVCACISNSDVKTVEPENIAMEISKLYPAYQKILLFANMIRDTNNVEFLMDYIDQCIDLKCRLVEIHPFEDGNGRTCRALLNLLFRKVGLPPVYVTLEEKEEYIDAMDKAIRLSDHSSIKKFYYYKICDSIIELDIKQQYQVTKTK